MSNDMTEQWIDLIVSLQSICWLSTVRYARDEGRFFVSFRCVSYLSRHACLPVRVRLLHFALSFPSLEPSNGVLSCPLEYVASVHALVVVQEHNVTLRHLDVANVFQGHVVHFLQLLVVDEAVVSKVHVGFVDLGSTVLESFGSVDGFTLFAELRRVGVDVAEPGGLSGNGMPDNRGLFRGTSLQHPFVVVSAFSPEHVDVKVYLGVDGGRNNSSHSGHDGSLDGIR
mmetsp:Transcript_17640/g.38540  ORF Transcript_17640/g.38540 Transcript_17640/m.38540 type:complete len:227 (-) Transcript_17640:565-1245(-)